MRLILTVLLLLVINVIEVRASGKVAIQLISFFNVNDKDYRGQCCNGDQVILDANKQCSKKCNTLITLCLDSYMSTADLNICPFGRRNLSAINDNSNIFFSVPTAGDVENPVLFPFNDNYQVILLWYSLKPLFPKLNKHV
jgi:hypothetical protein